jgi:hypothetical protein
MFIVIFLLLFIHTIYSKFLVALQLLHIWANLHFYLYTPYNNLRLRVYYHRTPNLEINIIFSFNYACVPCALYLGCWWSSISIVFLIFAFKRDGPPKPRAVRKVRQIFLFPPLIYYCHPLLLDARYFLYRFVYVRDRQLKVTRWPIFRKLKSSGPKHRKKSHPQYEF